VVAVELLQLRELPREAPVVPQVGEKREDALGWLLEVRARRDQAAKTTTS
jgi:hypothetical protein